MILNFKYVLSTSKGYFAFPNLKEAKKYNKYISEVRLLGWDKGIDYWIYSRDEYLQHCIDTNRTMIEAFSFTNEI